MLFSELVSITSGQLLQLTKDRAVDALVTDSRKPVIGEGSVFFAIKGERHDGHAYLPELYAQGLRQFVVESQIPESSFPDANILREIGRASCRERVCLAV